MNENKDESKFEDIESHSQKSAKGKSWGDFWNELAISYIHGNWKVIILFEIVLSIILLIMCLGYFYLKK